MTSTGPRAPATRAGAATRARARARRTTPATTWALRAVVLAGPVLALELGRAADHRPGLPWLVAVVVLVAGWAWRPGAWLGTAAVVVVVLWWTQAVRDELPVVVVLAAAWLLAAHVAALLADLGPPRLPLDPAVAGLWLVRGLLALGVAGGLWLLATAADDTRTPGVWVLALVVGLAAAAAAAVVLSRSNEGP